MKSEEKKRELLSGKELAIFRIRLKILLHMFDPKFSRIVVSLLSYAKTPDFSFHFSTFSSNRYLIDQLLKLDIISYSSNSTNKYSINEKNYRFLLQIIYEFRNLNSRSYAELASASRFLIHTKKKINRTLPDTILLNRIEYPLVFAEELFTELPYLFGYRKINFKYKDGLDTINEFSMGLLDVESEMITITEGFRGLLLFIARVFKSNFDPGFYSSEKFIQDLNHITNLSTTEL